MNTIHEIRDLFEDMYRQGEFSNGMLELVGHSFIADEPGLFGAPNEKYIQRELEWYELQSLNVRDIPGGTPVIWDQISDPDGFINSNYGYLLMSDENGDQFANVFLALSRDPKTRRATAIYTRPSMHDDWNRNGMQDFVCTNAVQYLIRDGELVVVVQMRSNDIVFGYRNDWAWQRHVQLMLVESLGLVGINVKPGRIIWNAASLHMYPRHFGLIDKFSDTGDWRVEL